MSGVISWGPPICIKSCGRSPLAIDGPLIAMDGHFSLLSEHLYVAARGYVMSVAT